MQLNAAILPPNEFMPKLYRPFTGVTGFPYTCQPAPGRYACAPWMRASARNSLN